MMMNAAACVEQHKQQINELNVFPVPDGDTGTNMSLTLSAAAADLRAAGEGSLGKVAGTAASALLRGAAAIPASSLPFCSAALPNI